MQTDPTQTTTTTITWPWTESVACFAGEKKKDLLKSPYEYQQAQNKRPAERLRLYGETKAYHAEKQDGSARSHAEGSLLSTDGDEYRAYI